MLRFKQFLMEGMQFVPGKGYVFVPDVPQNQTSANPKPNVQLVPGKGNVFISGSPQNQTSPNPAQSAPTGSQTPESLKPYAQPVLDTMGTKPSTPQPAPAGSRIPESLKPYAQPVLDDMGNEVGYRMRVQTGGRDELGRPLQVSGIYDSSGKTIPATSRGGFSKEYMDFGAELGKQGIPYMTDWKGGEHTVTYPTSSRVASTAPVRAASQTTQSPVNTQQAAPPQVQRQVVNVDPSKGVDIDDIAEPMKDAQGNITGYRIRGQVGYDEANRATVKSLRGSSNDIQIWKPKEGYSVYGTSDRIIEFAKKHGVDLPRKGLADLLGDKGELVIPVNRSGVSGVADAAKAAKAVGKTALKMVPFIGTAASLAAMGQRAQAGDYVGAGLEAASEVADYIPAVGIPISLGIQGYLAGRDDPSQIPKTADLRPPVQSKETQRIITHSPGKNTPKI